MKRRGFTLIELLVVISIIGVLVGIALPALMAARRHSKEKAVRATITSLEQAINAYGTGYGDFPPSGGMTKGANDINTGNETLVICLFCRGTGKTGGPFLTVGDWAAKLTNYDADPLPKATPNSDITTLEMFELPDEFNNPFIYFHWRDYAKPEKYMKYAMLEDKGVEARPQKDAKVGNYPNPSTFMLWSVGSDMKNNNGSEEDIAPWNK